MPLNASKPRLPTQADFVRSADSIPEAIKPRILEMATAASIKPAYTEMISAILLPVLASRVFKVVIT